MSSQNIPFQALLDKVPETMGVITRLFAFSDDPDDDVESTVGGGGEASLTIPFICAKDQQGSSASKRT